jgi:hypothetical protein
MKNPSELNLIDILIISFYNSNEQTILDFPKKDFFFYAQDILTLIFIACMYPAACVWEIQWFILQDYSHNNCL